MKLSPLFHILQLFRNVVFVYMQCGECAKQLLFPLPYFLLLILSLEDSDQQDNKQDCYTHYTITLTNNLLAKKSIQKINIKTEK